MWRVGSQQAKSRNGQRTPTTNGDKRMDRNPDGTFAPGNPGGPGRPKGSRQKLSEAFIEALADDFEAHGVATVQKLRADRPDVYVGAIGKLMPKLMELSGPNGGEIPLSGTVRFVGKSE